MAPALSSLGALGKLIVLSRYVEHCLEGEVIRYHLCDSSSFRGTFSPVFGRQL